MNLRLFQTTRISKDWNMMNIIQSTMLARVISKSCRGTHCHFCLNELPADTVPCPLCSIPVYCSECCQTQSGGDGQASHYSETECIQEHQHECRGANWPAVLPSDALLAGRVIMKLLNQGKTVMDLSNLQEILELSHSYSKMNAESKLELHLLSIVLVWCLSKSCCPDLSVYEASVTQVVLYISLSGPANLSLKSTLLSRNCAGSDILTSKDADDLGLQVLLSSIKDRGCLASMIFCHGNSVYHLLSRYIDYHTAVTNQGELYSSCSYEIQRRFFQVHPI